MQGWRTRNTSVKWCLQQLHGSEKALLVGLVFFAEIFPPCEIPCKIIFIYMREDPALLSEISLLANWDFVQVDGQGRQSLPKSGGDGAAQVMRRHSLGMLFFFFWNLMFMKCLFQHFEIVSLEQHLYLVFQSKRSHHFRQTAIKTL